MLKQASVSLADVCETHQGSSNFLEIADDEADLVAPAV
jgi:hypothetical protein